MAKVALNAPAGNFICNNPTKNDVTSINPSYQNQHNSDRKDDIIA